MSAVRSAVARADQERRIVERREKHIPWGHGGKPWRRGIRDRWEHWAEARRDYVRQVPGAWDKRRVTPASFFVERPMVHIIPFPDVTR